MILRKNNAENIRRKYNRISSYYDGMELLLEKIAFSRWRKMIFSFLEGDDILEVGVGTGKNFGFYPMGK
jgi:phosphatidylethanolamine/phosphatidyl-N-methylethanolamine N-methyltransferase